jgi:1,4-alpha-glucan branching enzyme
VSTGYLTLVLHAHLPYVRHPEHADHLEERWLHEAVISTYLPLIEIFNGLMADGVVPRVTLSLSPTLAGMLRDDLLRQRTGAALDRLDRLAVVERKRLAGNSVYAPLVEFYAERYGRLHALYDRLGGDLVGAFADLEARGAIELITVGATHGFQPTIREPNARRAQLEQAVKEHIRHLGRHPRGIWLPECGYVPEVAPILADLGLRYFFVDTHALALARPEPPYGGFAPVFTSSGVAAFARDPESSQQVWSADEGYPGDPAYRDFYRDAGFDAPLDLIQPFIHADGIRVHTGFKYHRVTGKVDLAHKAPYQPEVARERAAQHAANFLHNRQQQIAWHARRMDHPPQVVAPYDAELYGHWWFEGPMFLDLLLRKAWFDQDLVETITPSAYLARHPVHAVAELPPSSWGAGGFSGVWVADENDWIYRHQHRAEARMVELARRHAGEDRELVRRALNQAARELMLLQSSDWAFIMKNQTAVGYAVARVKAHLARFSRLAREIDSGQIDAGWLSDLESRDNLFPDLDFNMYR